MTSEGQDSALALSEAKDDATPDLPLLHDAPGTFGSMVGPPSISPFSTNEPIRHVSTHPG